MARAKVCGVTSRADLDLAVAAGAAAVGFTVDVDVDTPREIDLALAEELAALTPPFVTGTLVTMPDTAAEAVTLADLVGVDAIQVHGLPAEDVAAVAETFQGDVLAAVDHGDDLRAYAGAADVLLVDSLDESGAGGTGEIHDWARTREVVAGVDAPVVLAGGLTPENVVEAVRTVDPYAVDVASGVEREGGVKDPDAVRQFVTRASEAGAHEAGALDDREVDA
jgi:phosphoribosylanthranilate isomerase